MGAKSERPTTYDPALDFSAEELREFLEADHVAVRVDPAFKERLRRRLWDMVRLRGHSRGATEENR
jgi:hypothetical protein